MVESVVRIECRSAKFVPIRSHRRVTRNTAAAGSSGQPLLPKNSLNAEGSRTDRRREDLPDQLSAIDDSYVFDEQSVEIAIHNFERTFERTAELGQR